MNPMQNQTPISRPALQITPSASQLSPNPPPPPPNHGPPPTTTTTTTTTTITMTSSSEEVEPAAPPYSPLTPTAVASMLKTMPPYNPPSVLPRKPDATPIADSDNVDVIALRSAISILQLQHQTAQRDIRALDRLRQDALLDPEAYVKELVRRVNERASQTAAAGGGGSGGGVGGGAGPADLLAPTVGNLLAALGSEHELLRLDPRSEPEVLAEEAPAGTPNAKAKSATATKLQKKGDEQANGGSSDKDSDAEMEDDSDEDSKPAQHSKFPVAPTAQNVYRMPPVNWSKYQVVGGALDRLHEEQRRRPTPGQPERSEKSEEHVMAAPYAPVVDAARLGPGGINSQNGSEHPMVTRKGGRRVGS